jgi:hypothetical protein
MSVNECRENYACADKYHVLAWREDEENSQVKRRMIRIGCKSINEKLRYAWNSEMHKIILKAENSRWKLRKHREHKIMHPTTIGERPCAQNI